MLHVHVGMRPRPADAACQGKPQLPRRPSMRTLPPTHPAPAARSPSSLQMASLTAGVQMAPLLRQGSMPWPRMLSPDSHTTARDGGGEQSQACGGAAAVAQCSMQCRPRGLTGAGAQVGDCTALPLRAAADAPHRVPPILTEQVGAREERVGVGVLSDPGCAAGLAERPGERARRGQQRSGGGGGQQEERREREAGRSHLLCRARGGVLG